MQEDASSPLLKPVNIVGILQVEDFLQCSQHLLQAAHQWISFGRSCLPLQTVVKRQQRALEPLELLQDFCPQVHDGSIRAPVKAKRITLLQAGKPIEKGG